MKIKYVKRKFHQKGDEEYIIFLEVNLIEARDDFSDTR